MTPYQQLAQIRDRVGVQIVLRPYDEIKQIVIESGRVAVLIAHHQVNETATQVRLLGRTLHLREWKAVGDELIYNEMSIPDPSFSPTTESKFEPRTESDWMTRRAWENECGSPGAGRYGAPIQAEREKEYFG